MCSSRQDTVPVLEDARNYPNTLKFEESYLEQKVCVSFWDGGFLVVVPQCLTLHAVRCSNEEWQEYLC